MMDVWPIALLHQHRGATFNFSLKN